jgi:hypothetical protein
MEGMVDLQWRQLSIQRQACQLTLLQCCRQLLPVQRSWLTLMPCCLLLPLFAGCPAQQQWQGCVGEGHQPQG